MSPHARIDRRPLRLHAARGAAIASRLRALLPLLFLAVVPAAAVHAAGVGEPAPRFALPTAHGDEIALDRLRDQVVYVDFWASWCGPCRRSFPWMNEMQRKYGQRGLAIVAINVDKRRTDAERFLAQVPAEFPIVYDPAGTTPEAYRVNGMPTSYLIDTRGNVVAIEQGFRDERRDELEQRIRQLIGAR